jgi:hypothetical protein
LRPNDNKEMSRKYKKSISKGKGQFVKKNLIEDDSDTNEDEYYTVWNVLNHFRTVRTGRSGYLAECAIN